MACLPKCCCFKDRRARPQEQVELSEVKEVEPIPGDTFSFNIHFKNKKINPWQFDALTEVLHGLLVRYYLNILSIAADIQEQFTTSDN